MAEHGDGGTWSWTNMEDISKPSRGSRWKKICVGCGIALAILAWILFFIFLGSYFSLRHSDPAIKWSECQSELQNQSSQAKAQNAFLGQCREEENETKAQLADANRRVANMTGRWDSCQKRLNTLNENLTSEVEKCRALEECQSELQNQSSLMKAQDASLAQCRKEHETKERSDRLQAQLADANRRVANMTRRWDSCQKQLHASEDKATSWEATAKAQQAEKEKLQEKVNQLNQELQTKKDELKHAQDENQREKSQPSEDKPKEQCASRAARVGPIAALFPVIFGGLFFFLWSL